MLVPSGLGGDQHVRGFDVSVDQAALMCCVECACRLAQERERAFRLERSRGLEECVEVGAFDVAHGDVKLAAVFARIVNGNDVGVVDRCGDA